MRSQGALDAFGDPEFVIRILQSDSRAANGVDGGKCLLSRRHVSIVNSQDTLQFVVRPDDRGDNRRKASDNTVVVIVRCTARDRAAPETRWRARDAVDRRQPPRAASPQRGYGLKLPRALRRPGRPV